MTTSISLQDQRIKQRFIKLKGIYQVQLNKFLTSDDFVTTLLDSWEKQHE